MLDAFVLADQRMELQLASTAMKPSAWRRFTGPRRKEGFEHRRGCWDPEERNPKAATTR